MKNLDKTTDIVICECNSPDHNIIFRYFKDVDEFDEVYVSISLSSGGFWDRLKTLYKYIIYGKSQYGMYDEIVLAPDDETIKKMGAVVNHLKKIKKAQENKKKGLV